MQNKYSYNKDQKKAILYDLKPLLVLAGAGTGKTSTIIARIAYLVKNKNTLPESILALTFTNDAASHMRRKLKKEIGCEADKVEVCTFHAFSKNILIKKHIELGYSKHPELMNEGDVNFIIQKYFNDFGDLNSEVFKREPIVAIRSFKAIFESFRHNLFTDRELYGCKEKELENIKINKDSKEIEKSYQLIDSIDAFFKYQIWKKRENYIDYGDMIINLWKLLIEDKAFVSELQNQYKHVIVDEFQDNNYALSQIIKKIAEPENSIMVVGDDDQCIYSFRQANIQNIKEFKKYYGCTDIITLKKNYRSTSEIINLANYVINKNTKRLSGEGLMGAMKGKKPMLFIGNEKEQIYQIIECVKEKLRKDVIPNDMAILVRNHNKCKILYEAFLNEGIRTNYHHEKLFEQIIIKDFIALINICLASEREYLSTIRMLRVVMGEDGLFDMLSLYEESQLETDFLKFIHKANVITEPALKLLYEIKKIKSNDIMCLSTEVIKIGKLYASAPGTYKTLVRNKALDQLLSIIEKYCKSYGKTDLNGFITYLNIQFDMNDELVPPLDVINEIPSINLMTIHASKGMEFKYVMLPFMQSSVFPSRFIKEKVVSSVPYSWRRWVDPDRSDKEMYIEEERRLFYVAITRSMDSLTLFAPEKYQSSFIKEISKELLIEEKINFVGNERKYLEIKISRNKIFFENELCLGNKKSALSISRENEELEKILTIKDIKNINNHNPINEFFFKNMTLSASSINSFLNCPLQYRYKYINKIINPRLQSYSQVGKLIHFIIENFNKSIKKDKMVLFDLLDKYWDKCTFEYVQEEIQSKIDAKKMLENYWIFFNSYDIKKNISEYAFTFNAESVNVTGRCDSIFIDSSDNIILIDYKTSKTKKNEKELKEDIQVRIYSLFLFLEGLTINGEIIKKIPDKILIIYLRDTLIEVNISLTIDDIKETINKINEVRKNIVDNDFMAKIGRHCNYCIYKDLICPEFN